MVIFMADSFDTVVLLHTMRKENPKEDIFIEKSNGKRLVIHFEDLISDASGFVLIIKKERDIAINPDHIISIFNKGDL